MSKNDITMDTLRTRGPSKEYDEGYARIFGTKTPQAECAPREAQPVGPRTTLNYDGTFDTTCAHCGGNGCFACLKIAAPTPERADADTAGASERDALKQKGLDDHLRRLQQDGMKSEERADAGKDSALTEIAKQLWGTSTLYITFDQYKEKVRAILAANKEPK
jgi:hypothetical protein